MTELTREQIERDREWLKNNTPPTLWHAVDRQCDRSLRTHDAEAENARLREQIDLLSNWDAPDGRQYQAINRAALTECEARDREIDELRQRERQLYDALWTLDGHARLYVTLAPNVDRQVRKVLDHTPPPESESESQPDIARWADGYAERNADGDGQAHGDALAAAEESLRFLEGDGYRVSPRLVRHHHDIIRQALTASGVPYVPEAVVDEIVDEFEWMAEDEDGRDASHTPADWERLMLKDFAMLLLSEAPNRTGTALASAPADGLTRLEREDWGLVPVNVPTGGDDYDVEWTVIEYHMSEPKERVIGRGPTPRDALIAAAPQRVGE